MSSVLVGTFTNSSVMPAGIVYLPAVGVNVCVLPLPSTYVTTIEPTSFASAVLVPSTLNVNATSTSASVALSKLTTNCKSLPSSTVESAIVKVGITGSTRGGSVINKGIGVVGTVIVVKEFVLANGVGIVVVTIGCNTT